VVILVLSYVAMAYLDDRAVARLGNPPAWKQIDRSLLSKLLEPFWTFAANRTPRWVAPNAITLLGFVLVAIACAVMLVYCPAFDGAPPGFAYGAAVLSLFGFQTLDAIDGKQARRTGSASVLGNWLDHVCDVIALQLAMITAACSLGAGATGLTLLLVGGTLWNNYGVHWETKHTGVLFLGNGTTIYEAQFALMTVHAASWIFGPELWDRPLGSFLPAALRGLPLVDAALRTWYLVVGMGLIGGIGFAGSLVRVVSSTARTTPLGRAFVELVPSGWVLAAGGAAFALAAPPARAPLILAVSCLGLRLIGQMILSHLADVPTRALQPTLAPLTASCIYLGAVHTGLAPELVSDTAVAWANLAFAFVVGAHYFVGVTREMSKAIGVPILTLARDRGDAVQGISHKK
jgi:ethanolaminephosphotransferase